MLLRALFAMRGESSANQVSCLSVWQWAKHEFMNKPFRGESEKTLTAPNICCLKSACTQRQWRKCSSRVHRALLWLSSRSLVPWRNWSWEELQCSWFCLQSVQVPWGSAEDGAKLDTSWTNHARKFEGFKIKALPLLLKKKLKKQHYLAVS